MEGDPCGVLDDLLAGSYNPNDPLQTGGPPGSTANAAIHRHGGGPGALAAVAMMMMMTTMMTGLLQA